MTKRILVIDDDKDLVKLIVSKLTRAGYEAQSAYSGHDGLRAAYDFQPDLVILDILLGEEAMDGWVVCERLREMTNVSILMLSALGTEADKVKGLKLGADDYMTKSFSTPELLARVEALLRRGSLRPDIVRIVRYHDSYLSIDLETGTVAKRGQAVELTPHEFKLLAALLGQLGSVRAHQSLIQEVWGIERSDKSVSYLKVYVRQLRGKIERTSGKPQYILNMRGRGYYFKSSKDANFE
jgi:DNA-binding response OmpR family regulator